MTKPLTVGQWSPIARVDLLINLFDLLQLTSSLFRRAEAVLVLYDKKRCMGYY